MPDFNTTATAIELMKDIHKIIGADNNQSSEAHNATVYNIIREMSRLNELERDE